jgi:hypothetical protein
MSHPKLTKKGLQVEKKSIRKHTKIHSRARFLLHTYSASFKTLATHRHTLREKTRIRSTFSNTHTLIHSV